MDIYLVGGAVRDELLDIPVQDKDWVVTGATPDELLSRGYKQVGADFPVFLHPDTGEEYALARTERKNGRGYHGFSVYSAPDVTLEQDLLRRDLTINAMARASDGSLIDPYGGLDDIKARHLRHVSEAFAEDPLRILRTARFAARFAPLGFTVADETRGLMAGMVSEGELAHLAPERVWQEIARSLNENDPVTFYAVLRDCGALDFLIPELANDQAYASAMKALENAGTNDLSAEARFAAVMSPLDEPAVKKRAQALKAPNEFAALARLVCTVKPLITDETARQPEQLLAILDIADAWRRPERFEELNKALASVLPGQQKTLGSLKAAYELSASVDAKSLMAQGFSGKELGRAIRNERLRRIRNHLTQH